MSHWARVVKNIAYIYLLDAYGALCNTWSFASIVEDFLKQENAVVLPHPPYLPDLVQGDIFLFPGTKIPFWSNDWIRRLELCISVGDEYFEGTNRIIVEIYQGYSL